MTDFRLEQILRYRGLSVWIDTYASGRKIDGHASIVAQRVAPTNDNIGAVCVLARLNGAVVDTIAEVLGTAEARVVGTRRTVELSVHAQEVVTANMLEAS